jgi:hypothetical protein
MSLSQRKLCEAKIKEFSKSKKPISLIELFRRAKKYVLNLIKGKKQVVKLNRNKIKELKNIRNYLYYVLKYRHV